MPALKIIGVIILFFAFILSLKAKITVEYNDEVRLFVKVLFIKVGILPKKEKKNGPRSMSDRKAQKIKARLEKKAQKKRLKKQQKKQKKQAASNAPKKKKSLAEILDMIDMVKDIVSAVLKKFFGHLKIDIARLKIRVATGDAATTAIAYGAICDALTHLFILLDSAKNFKVPKEKEIWVVPDYLEDGIIADVKITFSIRVWHVFHVALAALVKFIAHTVKKKDKKS